MIRRKRRSDDTPSFMFPFLSVLVVIIGTLALIISGMTLLSLYSSEQVIQLTGSSEKTPVYVECRKEGILIHPEQISISIEDITKDESAWKAHVNDIGKQHEEQCLVFLVRPDGMDAFDAAYGMVMQFNYQAEKNKIDIGYDPVYAGGPITFKHTEKAKTP